MSTWEDTASREELLAFIDKLKRLHFEALDENERLKAKLDGLVERVWARRASDDGYDVLDALRAELADEASAS